MRSLRFVLFTVALLAALASACGSTPAEQQQRRVRERAEAQAAKGQKQAAMPVADAAPVTLARLEDSAIVESSGIVASRRNPGVFWTHNDSGDTARVFAFDREGRSRGTFRVEGAQARDWEDIAAGPGPAQGQTYLYVGDIGDNRRVREQVVVYRFPEPELKADAAVGAALSTEPAEAIRLKYPDGPHNAEALLVHPSTGDLYVVTKMAGGADVYKLAAPFSAEGVHTLARVATLNGPESFGMLITGGDISPDGGRVALCDYLQAYELTLPAGSKSFDEIWGQTPVVVPIGVRGTGIGEAICYRLDGAALLATSEGDHPPLIEIALLPRQKR
ncbi:MAG TPA: hypothetical protein VJ866_05990 [Pyrinomonadaceae bacterium]|nr:hypothetical protein [Pyrinomonadaceae bacterium]